jgi:serralysin
MAASETTKATDPGTPGAAINWENFTAPTVINVFFAPGGRSVYDYEFFTTTTWDAQETAAAKAAFQNFANVANVTFNYVNSIAQADFVMMESPNEGEVVGNFGYWGVGGGDLYYDGAYYDVDGWGVFNSLDSSWSHDNLQLGGYGYVTLIHEIGHGMGLAHPHDNGGGSEIMQGVTGPFDSYGDYNLNQGVYTTMSYNDGWHTAPHVPELIPDGTNYGFGWQATLMALDIAVLQEKYGVNNNYRRGNDTYILSNTNGPGTYYAALWDAAGKDTIRYDGNRAAVINLTAATLDYSATGGGVVSYVNGIYGGLTIANGAVIENAIGGNGKDKLTGNSAANVLNGRGGADTMVGLRGNDTYYVDHASDMVDERGGNGTDSIRSYIDFDLGGARVRGDVEKLILVGEAIRGTGNDLDNTLTGNAENNVLNGKSGRDTMVGLAGHDSYYVDNFGDIVDERGGSGKDTVRSTVSFSLASAVVLGSVENLVLVGSAARGTGNDLANSIIGNSENNILTGGGRADALTGRAGSDTFDFNAIAESGVGTSRRDIITDFSQSDRDKIDLSTIDAINGTSSNDAFKFLSGEGAGFTGAAGQLRFDQTLKGSERITLIEGDVNGDGIADFQIELSGWINLRGSGSTSDFVL